MSLTRLRRCLFALVCLLSASAAQAQVDDLLDRIRADGKLVLAHRESSVPFSYLDAQGRPVGYALDICLRLARAVQQALSMERLEVAYLPVTPANRIEAIEKGLAQLECGSTTNNAARRQKSLHQVLPVRKRLGGNRHSRRGLPGFCDFSIFPLELGRRRPDDCQNLAFRKG